MGASESGLAQKLFSEFDANKNDVLETRELDKFFSELTAADVSEEVISAMKKQAKEPDFTVPTDLAGLLQMARLTGQQKELEEKKYDFEKLLEITDFESFEKESGLKVGHVARLKRAIVKIKIAKDDAKTGLDKDSNGFVSKDEFVTFLKTIKISEDDSKKFQEILDKRAKSIRSLGKIDEYEDNIRGYAYETKGGVYSQYSRRSGPRGGYY